MTEEQKEKAKELLDSIAPATRFWVDATQTRVIKAEEKAIMEAMQKYAKWFMEHMLGKLELDEPLKRGRQQGARILRRYILNAINEAEKELR